jgi:Fic family protein
MQDKFPPFTITSLILKKCQQIAHELGVLEGAKINYAPIKLRKENQIKTIQSSLAIEGNSLTTEQITALLEGKRIVGPKKDILEVNNAIKVYSNLEKLAPLSISSFKQAHKILMNNIIQNNGQWRQKGVGIFKGQKITHVAPPASMVDHLMTRLFKFLNNNALNIPWIIKGSVFHYELEFIHPFSDGNGRMGRLWQQLVFMKENPIFQYISVETIIKKNQAKYYDVLAKCDKAGDSTDFVGFSLEQTLIALREYGRLSSLKPMDVNMRLQHAKEVLQQKWFSRKNYLELYRDISSATASRDLEKGVKLNIITKTGKQNLTKYSFRR